MLKFLLWFINWTWCLPQNIVALILRLFVKVDSKYEYGNAIVYRTNLKCGSISLGKRIFLCKSHWYSNETTKHEYGHTIQSLILGWLYLIVIGLPSLIWAGCFKWYRKKYNVSYYSLYCEKWADKLGGVDRQ